MTTLATVRAAMQEQGRSASTALPAPVLGWNARDSVDGKAPGFAEQLDNFFPYNGFVTLRGGSQNWSTGLGGPVETLARWADATQEKVVAGANGNLWSVPKGSATSLGSGFTSNRWEWDQVKGSRTLGTSYLYLTNGSDAPQSYDGTTLAPVTWKAATGQPTLTISNLQNVHISQDVLFLAEKGQLGFWHGAKGDVGPATELSWFDLGSIVPGGGELVDIATMMIDGGDGPDDYTVFVASTGWVALYRGGDPNQATDWALVGRYPLGETLGKRCSLEVAGDVLVLTVNGYISLRQFMALGGMMRQSFAFNDNIQPEVVRETLANKNFFGWQPILVPNLTLALFNVPTSPTTSVQHVVNTQTAAWARLRGWDGLCWLNLRDNLLFGTAGGDVVEANVGGTDVGGKAINGVGMTAFSDFGSRGVRKKFNLVRPVLETIGDVTVGIAMPVDYDANVSFIGSTVPSGQDASEWDTGEWDQAIWAGAPVTRTEWKSVSALGYSAALYLEVVSTGTRCRWKSSDFSLTAGGVL